MKSKSPAPCPCGRPLAYADCCAPLHHGTAAADAESLMRSRYSAYTMGLEGYLLDTWHASTRPAALGLGSSPQPKWLGLEVISHRPGESEATVEFVARYRVGGRAVRMRERSRFVRESGRWFYVDGSVD